MPSKKSSTKRGEGASSSSEEILPSGEEFREYLRAEAVRAVRMLLESVMREEMDALIGCGWGESSPNRNGYYERDLLTTSGKIENLKVPRDRAGEYESQVFEQYQRNEPAINAAVTEMYVAGASVAKVGGAVEKLTGTLISASAVSRISGDLTSQFLAWQKRELNSHYRIFYLDAVRYQVRHQNATDSLVVLVVLAVDLEGKKGSADKCRVMESKSLLSKHLLRRRSETFINSPLQK